MNLKGKTILFLSANFFDYEKAIAKRLSEFGAEVTLYNERPSDSVLSKGLIRVKRNLYQRKINAYYRRISEETKGKNYDFFLLIKGETIPFSFLEQFRARNPQAKMIFYSYDAATEYPKFLDLYRYFDLNFTFEPTDALKHQLHFRPLFSVNVYAVSEKNKDFKYDLSFIGTAHTDRYIIGEKVNSLLKSLNLKTFFYYFAPGKTAFFLKKIFDKNLQQFDFKKLTFNKLSHQEIANIYKESFAVLDINKPFQQGLTMRTFEALASGKKLVTTNSDIINYPFYSSLNIDVIDRENPDINPQFFKSSFQNINANILEKMSLDSWIECLFEKNQDEFWGISSWKMK